MRLGKDLLPQVHNGLLDYCHVMKLMLWHFYINFGLRITIFQFFSYSYCSYEIFKNACLLLRRARR